MNEKTRVPCDRYENMKKICKRFCAKIDKNYKGLFFIHDKAKVNKKYTFMQQAKKLDKTMHEMYISVFGRENIKISLKYKIHKNQEILKIFGPNFVKKNKTLFRIVFNGKERDLEIPSKLRKIPNYDIFKYILYGAFYKNIFIAEYENPYELNQSFIKQGDNINPNDILRFPINNDNNISEGLYKSIFINEGLLSSQTFNFKICQIQ